MIRLKFDKNNVDKEIKRIKSIKIDDKARLMELMQDWAYSVAFAVAHENKPDNDPLISKFGSEENFTKYVRALASKLHEAGYKINISNPKISKYFENFKFSYYIPEYNDDDDDDETNQINEDILSDLPNMIVNKGFIKIVGSSLESDSPNDLDVYINAEPEDVPEWLHKRIQILFSKQFDLPVQIIYNKFNGPIENYIDVYDLVLINNTNKNDMYFSKPDIPIIKPYKTFWNTITENDIPFQHWVMQPKYNGMKIIIMPDGSVYSENMNRLKLDLDFIFRKKPNKDIIFIGEVWSKKLPRQTSVGYAKKGIMTKDMLVTIYDAVETDNLHVPYKDRFNYILRYIKNQYIVPEYDDLSEMKKIMKYTYFDGIIIKNLDASFTESKQMIKVKKEIDFDAKVIDVLKTKNGTYIYKVAFDKNGELVYAGKTMATKDKCKVGDIIEIAPLEITHYNEDDKLKIYVSRVKGISTNTKPDEYDTVIKVAKIHGLLNEV